MDDKALDSLQTITADMTFKAQTETSEEDVGLLWLTKDTKPGQTHKHIHFNIDKDSIT